MQRQVLYRFLYTHENTCHRFPAKTIPRDKQSTVLAYRGKGIFFIIVLKIYLYLRVRLTYEAEPGDCQNRGDQCYKKYNEI